MVARAQRAELEATRAKHHEDQAKREWLRHELTTAQSEAEAVRKIAAKQEGEIARLKEQLGAARDKQLAKERANEQRRARDSAEAKAKRADERRQAKEATEQAKRIVSAEKEQRCSKPSTPHKPASQ